MSLDDNDDKKRLPYRHGGWAGRDNERDMLFNTDGSASFKTRIRDLPDGSRVMLRTKDGMPQFTITKSSGEGVIEYVIGDRPYLESGQLEFPYPAPLSPYADSAATWNFLDIAPSEDFLAVTKIGDANMGDQLDGQVLHVNQTSKSICDQSATSQDVLNKKMCLTHFPASMWSGRMRAFMQAQYGQIMLKESGVSADYKFRFRFVGGAFPQIHYVVDPDDEYSETINFGWTAGGSVGIFKDAAYNYWLIKVIQNETGYTLRAYPILFTLVGRVIRQYMKNTSPSADLEKKLEAYLFACAVIHPVFETIGSFGVSADAMGEPMGYGWKFKNDGSEASIVILKVRNEGTPDAVFISCKLIFRIGRAGATWNEIEVDESAAQEWTDGWGVFNLFIPEGHPSIGKTKLLSLQISGFCRPPFHFSDVEIYGYYDKDDVWVPTLISGEAIDTTSDTVAEYGGGYRWSASYAFPATSFSFDEKLYRAADEGGWWEARTKLMTHNMSIAVGNVSVAGRIEYGASHRYETEVISVGGPCSERKIGYLFLSTGSAPDGAPTQSGYSDVSSYSLDPWPWITGSGKGSVTQTIYLSGTSYAKGRVWAFVVPCNDCSAAHVAESNVHEHVGGTKTVTTTTNALIKQTCHDIRNGPPGPDVDITPWVSPAYSTGSNVHPYWGGLYTSDYMGPETPPEPPTDIDPVITTIETDDGSGLKKQVSITNNFTLKNLHGAFPCSMSPTFGSLFLVPRGRPYYEPTIRTTASINGRHYSTEGTKQPDNTTNTSFIGWA